MDNQMFQSRRFANYMKKYIYERRTSLAVTISLYLLFEIAYCAIFPYLLGSYADSPKGPHPVDPMWSSETKFFMIFMVAAAVGCGGSLYEVLRKKNDRIVTFTCPASSFEKFLTYFLIYVIFMTALSVGGMFFADAVKVWIYSNPDNIVQPAYIPASYLLTLGNGYFLTLPGFSAEEYVMIRKSMMLNTSLFYSLFIITFAFFSLGGTIWAKKSVTKSLFAAWIMIGVCITLFYLGAELFHKSGILVLKNGMELSYTQMSVCILVFSTILSIFTWWVSYARFKEWEVIHRW